MPTTLMVSSGSHPCFRSGSQHAEVTSKVCFLEPATPVLAVPVAGAVFYCAGLQAVRPSAPRQKNPVRALTYFCGSSFSRLQCPAI